MTDEKKKRRGPRFEYLEVSIHGDPGTENNPNMGEGRDGYIAKLNLYAAQGWHVVNVDIDTTVRIRVILEREILEDDDDGRTDRKDP